MFDSLCIQNYSRLYILSHPKITVTKLSFLWIKIPSYIAGNSASYGWEVTGPCNHCWKLWVHLNITDTQNECPACSIETVRSQDVNLSLYLFHPFRRWECHSWDSTKGGSCFSSIKLQGQGSPRHWKQFGLCFHGGHTSAFRIPLFKAFIEDISAIMHNFYSSWHFLELVTYGLVSVALCGSLWIKPSSVPGVKWEGQRSRENYILVL